MIILSNHHSKSNFLEFKWVNSVYLRFLLITCNTLLVASHTHAATYYWDSNGTTSGFGVASGTWTTPTNNQWTSSSAGTSTVSFNLTTGIGDDVHFGGSVSASYIQTGTVNVSGTVNVKNITYGYYSELITLAGGTINLGAASTITNNSPQTKTISSSLTGAGTSLTITGGPLVLSGNNSYAGQTIVTGGSLAITGTHSGTGAITLNSGILNLGNSTSTGSLAATVLNMNGGEFRYTRTDSATHSFATTLMNSSQATFVVNANNTLNLGTISRTLGVTTVLSYTGLGKLAAYTASNVGGIIPGVHLNNSWAVANGEDNAITALANASYTQTSVAGTTAANYSAGNIDVNSSAGTLSAGISANSIRFSSAAANTLSLTATNILSAGGILVSNAVGTNLSTITGGSIAGADNKDLQVIQNNSSAGLTIASNISNNIGPVALTKSGAGLLTLSGSNSFTGGLIINEGEVVLANSGALNASSDSENAVRFTNSTTGTLSLKGNNVTIRSLDGAFGAVNNSHTVQNNHSTIAATLTIGNELNLNSNFEGLVQNGSAGAPLALVKKGTGRLIIGGTVSNTYNGGTTIYAGTVQANHGAALGPSTCTLTFAGDSTLQTTHSANPTFYQNIVINSGVTAKFDVINQFYSMTFNGPVSGSGTLWIGSTDNGQGNTFLNNASNTHTGTLRIGDGTRDGKLDVLSIADANNPIEFGGTTGSGYLNIYGASARNFSQRTFTLSGTTGGASIKNWMVGGSRLTTITKNLAITGVGNKTLTLGGTNLGNNAFNGFIPDGVGSIISFTKENYGKWVLSKTANTYSGPTKIMDGLLEIKKLSNGSDASSIGQSVGGPKNLIFGPGPGPDPNTPVEGTLRYTGTGDSTDRNFIMLGNATLDSSGSGPIVFTQTDIISPSVPSLTGTFYLGNPVVSGLASTADFMIGMAVTSDAFSGTKIITAITSSTITLNSGTGIQFGTFGFSVGYAANRILKLGGTQTGANTISGILQDSPNHSNTSSPGVLNILKQDAGTWVLSGNNTYTGTTTVTAGTLAIARLSNGGLASSIGQSTSAAANLLLSNDTTLLYNGNGDSTDRSFTINGTIAGHKATLNASGIGAVNFTNTASPAYNTNDQARTLILSGSNTGANTLGAHISNNGSGVVSLIKNDPGTWILGGVNTYTGNTTVNAGTLLINGSLSSGSAVSVNGTATLGGSGSYGGSLTMADNVNLAPGASIGTLSIGGSLNISAMAAGAGKLHYELGSIAISDKIAVTGTLNIGSSVFGFNDFTFTRFPGIQNGTYTLITSGATISGTLDGNNLTGPVGTGGTGTLQISADGTSIELVVNIPPFYLWSEDAAFNDVSIHQGLNNGMAFLLGAQQVNTVTQGLLPIATQNGGNLMLDFKMLNASNRGTAVVKVEYSSDLSIWTEMIVPEASSGPIFNVSVNGANPNLNDVTVTLPASEAVNGKLFMRLKATE